MRAAIKKEIKDPHHADIRSTPVYKVTECASAGKNQAVKSSIKIGVGHLKGGAVMTVVSDSYGKEQEGEESDSWTGNGQKNSAWFGAAAAVAIPLGPGARLVHGVQEVAGARSQRLEKVLVRRAVNKIWQDCWSESKVHKLASM